MTHVLEFARFRLVDGADEALFLAAARATEQVVTQASGFTDRRLTKSEDGFWTDVVEWTSLDAAQNATAEVMKAPEFAAFGAFIDESSLTMRHEPIALVMG